MTDFQTMRRQMRLCQLGPAGVTSPAILAAFEAVPRQAYVPADLRPICYADDHLVWAGGYMLAPVLLARMIAAAGIVPQTRVRIYGDETGYTSAILAHLGAVAATGDSPVEVILGAGAVAQVPPTWIAELAPQGRIVVPVVPVVPGGAHYGCVQRMDASGSGRSLFDASAPYIPGYEPVTRFKFG